MASYNYDESGNMALYFIITVLSIILVPFTLFGTGYIFNRAFFTGWVVVSFI